MKNLLIIFTCLLSCIAQAQSNKFTFKLGSQYELPRKTQDLSFFGNPTYGIVNLSLDDEALNVLRFDAVSLVKTDEKVIDLAHATKNFNSEDVTDFNNGNYFWIHSDWNKESEKESLYYDKIDVSNAKIISKDNKMFEASKLAGDMGSAGGLYKFKIINKYQFNYSADKSKLLVTYRLHPENRNDKENFDKIGFYVYDDNMNKIWNNEFTMPYTEAIMDNSDFSVDTKGNAYLLAKVYDNDKRREKDKETGLPAYHYEALKFTKDSKTITHTPIALDDNFIKESSLIESPTHDMIIACTYTKKAKHGGTDGVFLAMINESGKVVKYKNGYYEFPKADLEKFETERTKRKMERKDDYEAPSLKVRNVLAQPDGSVFITCEEYFTITTNSGGMGMGGMGGGASYQVTTYYYQNIIAAKINGNGAFAWLRKIPKNQRGSNSGTGTMSFKLITDSSGYYFLYLDNIHNMDLAEDETPKAHIDGAGGQVIVSKLDNNGNLSKELLFDTREEEVMIFPTQFKQINKNQFIGRAKLKKRNNFKPLLITVK